MPADTGSRGAERDGSPRTGFSLLEVLIATALVGLIALSLSGGLRLGARAWESQGRIGARQGDLDAPRTALDRLIAGSLLLEGDAVSLKAVTRMPAALEAEGLHEVTLALTVDGRLVLGWRPWRRGLLSPPPFTETELARGIAGIAIDYLGTPLDAPEDEAEGAPSGGAAPLTWQPAWSRDGEPPRLVRIRLALPPGDPRAFPELVAAARLGARS